MKPFKVTAPTELMSFLRTSMPEVNRTRIKQMLKYRLVQVNGRPVSQFDFRLNPGDEILIENAQKSKSKVEPLHGVKILFEDEEFVVINKPAGLLTISTEKEKIRTAFFSVNDYLNRSEELAEGLFHRTKPLRKKQAFLVHRIDQETSGVLMFAKSEDVKNYMQENWKEVEKIYRAVAEGEIQDKEGTVSSWLTENKILRVYSGPKTRASKWAITHFKVLRAAAGYSEVEVRLETGRKHQIRVHLASMGHPLAGDKDYGAQTDPAGRVALHAFSITFQHPLTGEKKTVQAPLPGQMEAIFHGR